ncbi:MAG TPA: M28 family peptidase [Terriglobia bacterium]|nr:M28 family peptidase [Terriglobia bacterium]
MNISKTLRQMLLSATACLLACSVLFGAGKSSAGGGFHLIPARAIEARLKSAPRNNLAREHALKKMFEAAGCASPQLSEESIGGGQPPNLICTSSGEESSLIVVGGHMDHVRHGEGIVDDWSGASMLPSLYESLRSRRRKHTFVFIGFSQEEKGRRGSKFYLRHLSPGFIHRIHAMVNLECLGMNPPEVWTSHAGGKLLACLNRVARGMGTYLPGVDLENVGYDDADSFRHFKIPTITIHSLTQDTLSILHSKRDNFAAEHMNYYYDSYRIIANYLVSLDAALP